MSYEIKFGTDGWRATIADGFTFENVKRVSQAACDVIRKTSKSRLLLVGYDRRFFSDRYAATAAEVAVSNGFRVELSEEPISSPALSFQVRQKKAAVGFMITASHNPYQFNGFKLKGTHGGSVNEVVTKEIEDRMDTNEVQKGDDKWKKADFATGYLSNLKKLVRWPNLANLQGKVVFDAMHGPGGELFQRIAGKDKKVVFVRTEPDPLFGGTNPEPIERNLSELKKRVLEEKAAIGIAVDGDADRIGVVDDKGRYLPPHTVMPLLLLHLIENKKLKGKIVQTVSMGYMNERIAKQFGLPFEEVAVGFKYIANIMGKEKVLLGGEESGGYGVGLWSPERDGLLCALLLLEMLAKQKKPLSFLVGEMQKRFGESYFERVDFPVKSTVDKTAWITYLASILGPNMAGMPIKKVNTVDGLKIVLEDDSWFLLRPSGTEPLIRTYSEATSPEAVKKLLQEAKVLAGTPLPSPKKESAVSAKQKKKKK